MAGRTSGPGSCDVHLKRNEGSVPYSARPHRNPAPGEGVRDGWRGVLARAPRHQPLRRCADKMGIVALGTGARRERGGRVFFLSSPPAPAQQSDEVTRG
jgi:hypothetical protein